MNPDDFRPRYGPHTYEICDTCNYDLHRCHFCGGDLAHTLDRPSGRTDRHPCYERAT